MPKIVILWSDAFVFALVALLVWYVIKVRRQPTLAATWRKVWRDPASMSALIVTLAFAAIGLVDSVHFRPQLPPAPDAPKGTPVAYGTRTLSLLDVLLEHQLASREKTYSAPLAYRSFVKEVRTEGEQKLREFPRLAFGGRHLTDPARQWRGDVLTRGIAGAVGGALAALALGVLFAAVQARRLSEEGHADGNMGGNIDQAWRQMMRGETELPWRAILATVSVLCVLAGIAAALAPHYHLLGTDQTGNDVFYQVMKSVRTALVMGSLTTLATLPVAVPLGLMSGYFKGWVDDAIQYVYTVLSAVPPVLLIAACVLLIQVFIDEHPQLFETGLERADLRLFFLCMIVGVTQFATICRLLRAETLKLRELEYVQAAQAFGVGPWRIMGRHIAPNVMHIVLISVVLNFSDIILYEAVLSYVGVGVDPSMNSFGTMINLARFEMARDPLIWWNLATAFVFMLSMVLAGNLFADGVRDAFDPRARAYRPRLALSLRRA
jgi:peptide/nickel transport system permease protein